ncbi:MAG: PHP domain-containing protein, partial [Methanobacteriota archaeon]
MLDILGEDTFRSLSYQRAARQLESLTENVEDLVREGRVDQIPGIGRALAEKIVEYVTTGRIGYYDELRAKFPPGVLDLLKVRGLGPKKVKILWQQLGITDLDTLKAAAEKHLLRRVKGFGEKTEENILRAIELVKEGEARTFLVDAARIVDAITQGMKASKTVERIEAAGSFRRMRETVGDVDILAVAKNRAAAGAAFERLPGVVEVLASGETKVVVRLEYHDYEGSRRTNQVDLRILDPDSWGAGLQYFTGSKDHNIRLRTMAERRGLKMNEYGVFRDDQRIAGDTEESMYSSLELEIDLAATGQLPKLVELPDIRGDFHVHTNATDGTEPLEAMVEAARRRGYSFVGISDHSVSATVASGMTAEQALSRRDRVRALNRELKGFTVLLGTECDILDGGEMDYPDEVLKELDFVIASVHSRFTLPEETQTARIVAAVQNPHVSILGHPTTRQIGWRGPLQLDLDDVFKACAKAGTAIEIDADPRRMDLNSTQARAAKNRAAAGAAFERLPGVVEVLASGETKVVVRLEYHDYEGSRRTIQVDLRILDPDSWGAGLQYFTGSKDHNIRLRTMAERRGLKMNEYGVFRDDQRIAGDTEESMYSSLE